MLCKPFHFQSSEKVDLDSFCPFSHFFEGRGRFWRPSQLGSLQFWGHNEQSCGEHPRPWLCQYRQAFLTGEAGWVPGKHMFRCRGYSQRPSHRSVSASLPPAMWQHPIPSCLVNAACFHAARSGEQTCASLEVLICLFMVNVEQFSCFLNLYLLFCGAVPLVPDTLLFLSAQVTY